MKKPGDILADELREAKSPRDYSKAYKKFYTTADSHAAAHIEANKIELACGNCSYCCHQWVRVLAHEVFAIVDHIQSTSESSKKETIQLLEAYHEKTRHLNDDEKDRQNMPLPCPFLADGRCSIYSVRPSNCRAFHSLDKDHCESCLKRPNGWPKTPADESLTKAWTQILKTADFAYHTNNLDQTTYDLVPSCLAALSNPALRRRWVSKKKTLLSYDS
tara:strand:- start:231 stop:884 length:654 start_codon:yes stop_codon:yes gene_type:complete